MRIIGTEPPHCVIGAGVYYPIRTDFSVWLEFARLIEQEEARGIVRALNLCYKSKSPEDPIEAIKLLCEFFAGGASEERESESGEQIISFTQDEELIYASFLSEYGIDLSKEKLHWWRFLALLKNLSPDSSLMRVAHIRAAKLSDIKNPALRRSILRQKRIYSLNQSADAADAIERLFVAEKEKPNG